MNVDNVFHKTCAICGEASPDSFRIWFDGYIKLYKCLRCGFVSQFPGPDKSTVITDYEDCYSLDFLKRGQEFKYPHRHPALKDILDRVSRIKADGKILDVGCGDGHFLYLCSKAGFNCYGIESSKQLSSYAQTKTGAKIIQGLYKKEMFPEKYFDVIVIIQVLEHIPTPVDVLEAAKYHLRPGGIIVIEIPSISSPHFLAYRGTRIKSFVKPPHGIINSHFGYYAPKTLITLTEKCGFNEISLVTGRWFYKYSGVLRQVSRIIDPVLNIIKIGGILYIGQKN
jgi:SAM-dependent methyltransferase